jgi:hypothetical protein
MMHIAGITRISIFAKLDFNIIQRRMTAEFCPQFINHIPISEAQFDRDPMLDSGAWRGLCHGFFDFIPQFYENKDRAMPVAVDQVLAPLDQLGLLNVGQAVQVDFADGRVEEPAARCDLAQQRLERFLMPESDCHPAMSAAFCRFNDVGQDGHEASIQNCIVRCQDA